MDDEEEYDYMFKILLIGAAAVGKSSILLRYADNIFDDNYLATVGIDFRICSFELEYKTIKLLIWDTAGQERFKNLTSTYYKGAHGVVFVFDVTDPNSFENIEGWVHDVKEHAGSDLHMILLGNKCDLEDERKVSKEEAKEYAKSKKMAYYDTSAKNDENIGKSFKALSKILKDKHDIETK